MDFRKLRKRLKEQVAGEADESATADAPSGSDTESPEAADNARGNRAAEPDAEQEAEAQDPSTHTAHDEREVDAPSILGYSEETDELRSDLVEILRFRLDREFFALRLEEIEEIIKPKQLTWVPRAPEWIPGVLSLRGSMVPVVDLRMRLGITAGDAQTRRVVIVEHEDEPCGLIVDEILNVDNIDPEEVEEVPPGLQRTQGRYLEGLLRLDDTLVAMVDLDEVLYLEGDSDERAA